MQVPSKHGHGKYQEWMGNLLGSVRTPMVIFTDEASAAHIRALRRDFADSTHVVVTRLDALRVSEFGEAFWAEQVGRAPARSLRAGAGAGQSGAPRPRRVPRC